MHTLLHGDDRSLRVQTVVHASSWWVCRLRSGTTHVGATGAAVSAALGWWPLVSLGLAVRLAGANLDGAVARARRLERPWGFVVNEMGDRASDLVMFAGLAAWAARQSGAPPVILGAGGSTRGSPADFRVVGRSRGGGSATKRRTGRQDGAMRGCHPVGCGAINDRLDLRDAHRRFGGDDGDATRQCPSRTRWPH